MNSERGTRNRQPETRNPKPGIFIWPVRVYYEDTDSGGVVRAITLDYFKPALFNDMLEVTVELAESRRSQMVLAQSVRCGHAAQVEARVRLACVNSSSFKPVKMPVVIIEKLGKKP
ncbi:MAG: hotdog domain-containing protein [Burkholderiales bacterium]